MVLTTKKLVTCGLVYRNSLHFQNFGFFSYVLDSCLSYADATISTLNGPLVLIGLIGCKGQFQFKFASAAQIRYNCIQFKCFHLECRWFTSSKADRF